jgi:hypothetical protein
LRKPQDLGRIKKVTEGSENHLGSQINDKNVQVSFLKQRLNMFIDVLDAIDPEETDLEDIDRLISILDEMESKCREFNNRDLPEPV